MPDPEPHPLSQYVYSESWFRGCWKPGLEKTAKKLKNRLFHKNRFFDNFKLNMGGLGVSGGMAWTVRTDSSDLWQDLVLLGMGVGVVFQVLPCLCFIFHAARLLLV
mgnify:CR=1 FL=1